MLECPGCQKQNPIFARFCAYCRTPLNRPKAWAMAGCDAARSGWQEAAVNFKFAGGFVETADSNHPANLDLPQPVIAHDTLWFWELSSKRICGIRLKNNLQGDAAQYSNKPDFSQPVAGQDAPHYGNSLVFDGVFLLYVRSGTLWRFKVIGNIEQPQPIYSAPGLNEMCRAAPLLVWPDPQKTERYFVACLKKHLLVADVSRKDSTNSCRLFRWQEDGGNDEMHSAAAVGRKVFCISLQGKVFMLDLTNGLQSLAEDGRTIDPKTRIQGCFCAAPVAVGSKLVFEVLKNSPPRPGINGHERGVATLDAETLGQQTISPIGCLDVQLEDRNNFGNRTFLPGLANEDTFYFQGDQGSPVLHFKPQGQALAKWNLNQGIARMNPVNTVLAGGLMIVVNIDGTYQGWKLDKREEAFRGALAMRGQARLLARPVVYQNLMVLILPGRVCLEAL